MLNSRQPGAAHGAGPSTSEPHASTRGWFRLPAASHRLPEKPVLRGISMRETPPEPVQTSALAGLAAPRRFASPEGFLYSPKDAHIFIETRELSRRRRFPGRAPTFVYREDSMQIFIN